MKPHDVWYQNEAYESRFSNLWLKFIFKCSAAKGGHFKIVNTHYYEAKKEGTMQRQNRSVRKTKDRRSRLGKQLKELGETVLFS